MPYRKKLIEVALPLEAINLESAREKSIRHGHPSTLHLWWARRPLAACRAVLWASLVDDPSSWPDRFPTEADQERERQHLFDILGRIEIQSDKKGNTKPVVRGLVSWDDVNDPNSGVLEAAQQEIARCLAWERGEEPPTDPAAVRDYIARYAPPVYDPFAGGGSIPLEAQRLGLETHASDLNPVAVLINKALIEIPPKFKDKMPINPEDRAKKHISSWRGAQGLAADVRYYGAWMREQAFERIGHLYPSCSLCLSGANHEGTKDTKENLSDLCAFVVPKIRFGVKSCRGKAPAGTVDRKGARCIACGTPVPLDHVRQEGRAGRMGAQLMAIVAEGPNGRVYLPPTAEKEAIAQAAQPTWKPDTDLPKEALGFRVQNYGMTKHADLFTPRQLVALTTFSDLVAEAREKAIADAIAAGLPDDDVPLAEGGTGARAYGEAISVYLAFGVSRAANTLCTIARWTASRDQTVTAFARQAIPMTWDYPDVNPFSGAAGDLQVSLSSICEVLEKSQINSDGCANQHDATAPHPDDTIPKLISTDPPYFDNIGYADLSDFFYVWLRRSLGSVYPNICSTLLVPKTQELVATPYRFGGSKQKAKEFFETGLGKAFNRLHYLSRADYPLTVYYAFKQSEEDPSPPDLLSHEGREGENSEPSPSGRGQGEGGRASTGWETMLEGLIRAGFTIDGTWPMRTERSARSLSIGTNALASSIVLVCRPRPADAPKATRRQFLNELKQELPKALHALQQGSIAPVDLAQASIGPGMAVYSRYAAVLENDGSPLTVRTALQLINQYLDEYLTEQEGEFDTDTRWAITWFAQHQFEPGPYGEAETLSKARNTSVQGMVEAGILEAKAGKVRLLSREALTLPASLSPGVRVSDWLITQALIHQLDTQGEMGAAQLLSKLGDRGAMARDLAYRLYSLCDKKGWTQEAIFYNSLVISWPEIDRLASEVTTKQHDPLQTSFL